MSAPLPPSRAYPENRRKRLRSVGVPDELWEAVKARAAERGETVTDVILRALRRYVRN